MQRPIILTILNIMFLFLLLSVAFAQPNIIISPQSIVINPYATEAYDVEVFVDKDVSGDATPVYNIGESITISVRANQDSYVYLFNVRSDGTVDQILPNRFDASGEDNFILANTVKTFPPPGANYRFDIDGPSGLDKVIAVASKTELDVTELASFQSGENFASSSIGEQGFAKTLSIIVEAVLQENWITDTSLFYVVDNTPAPTPIYGQLLIQSNIADAPIYIDGEFRGFTRGGKAVSIGETIGTHNIQINVAGYGAFEQDVNVIGGSSTVVDVTLVPLTGTLIIQTNAPNGQIFVNGKNYGLIGNNGVGRIRDLTPGNYEVIVISEGYNSFFEEVMVNPGKNTRVQANQTKR